MMIIQTMYTDKLSNNKNNYCRMSKLTPRSSSSNFANTRPNKILFQTKFKVRGTNQSLEQNTLNQTFNHFNQKSFSASKFQSNNRSIVSRMQNASQLDQSSILLNRLNFSHHDSDKCLCNECLCGRHLCKLHVLKPDLKKTSTYMNNFKGAKSIKNNRITQKDYDNILPKVQMNSTYSFSFKNKDPNIVVKPRPKDELTFDGPSQQITSYRAMFPGNKGGNPYVRPKQLFISGQFPLKNKVSAYKESYSTFYNEEKTGSGRINDQLKTGSMNCFRESFYQQKFKSPNPQDYSAIVKNHQKLQINPNYARQYQTSYDQEFIPTEASMCPAKIKMETKLRDTFNDSKGSFNQNSDFKAFSSSYHALSMASPGLF